MPSDHASTSRETRRLPVAVLFAIVPFAIVPFALAVLDVGA